VEYIGEIYGHEVSQSGGGIFMTMENLYFIHARCNQQQTQADFTCIGKVYIYFNISSVHPSFYTMNYSVPICTKTQGDEHTRTRS